MPRLVAENQKPGEGRARYLAVSWARLNTAPPLGALSTGNS